MAASLPTPVAEIVSHPHLWLGLLVSILGLAIFLEGISSRIRHSDKGYKHRHNWYAIVLGALVSAFFFTVLHAQLEVK